MSTLAEPRTVTAYLRPIDRDGLMAFAEAGRGNPGKRGTNKVHTVTEGQYRTLNYVGHHAPVVVDEPPHLFGQDTAPAPSEILLSALGGCLCVGVHAVATARGVRIRSMEVMLEGDIGNPAAWGAGGAHKQPAEMGFQAVRAKVVLDADAPREVLAQIVRDADYASPMANCFRNPIPTDVALA